VTQAPTLIRFSNPLTRRLLRIGVPMGPNVLLTVRGRTSGLPRTAPVAIADIGGRRWVIAAYGDVHWVRNLRAAGEGMIRENGRDQRVVARELDEAGATDFYGALLPAYIAELPAVGRFFIRLLFRLAGPEVLNDPIRAAARHPVFELSAR
jgi:deazaflavin-dependent oxidoreductase (nitroreductase family)